jgi:hypothetical protein
MANIAVVAGALLLVAVAAWELVDKHGRSQTTHRTSPPTRPAATTTSRSILPTTIAGKTAPKPPSTLVLRATRGDCWLSVQIQASDKTVYEQTLGEGTSVRFGLKKPLAIRFGAPANVDATIAGHDVGADLLASTTAVVVTANGMTAAG